MKTNIDVNLIIENLTQEVSKYICENAILKAQISVMNEVIDNNESEINNTESND